MYRTGTSVLYHMFHRTCKPHCKRVKDINRPYRRVAITCSYVISYIIIIIIIHQHDLLSCYLTRTLLHDVVCSLSFSYKIWSSLHDDMFGDSVRLLDLISIILRFGDRSSTEIFDVIFYSLSYVMILLYDPLAIM